MHVPNSDMVDLFIFVEWATPKLDFYVKRYNRMGFENFYKMDEIPYLNNVNNFYHERKFDNHSTLIPCLVLVNIADEWVVNVAIINVVKW